MCGVVVVAGTPDQRLAALADAQHGRVGSDQLRAIGFTKGMVRARLAAGVLRVLHRGVYAVGHVAQTELGDEAAALLVCRRRGVVSHERAAALMKMVSEARGDVHVTLLGGCRVRSRPGIVVHRSRLLTPADISRHKGLPITSAAWTLIDLAETWHPREVERALDEGLHRGLVSPTKLREAMARAPGRRGVPVLEALLEPGRGSGVTRSGLERRVLEVLRAAGLGGAHRNHQVGPFSLDLFWPEARFAIEVDSYEWHSGPWAFRRDRRKDAFLADHGIVLMRITDEMVEDPLPLVARVARTIAERRAADA